MTAIIDYKMGNLASVRNALAKLGHGSAIVAKPELLGAYERIILPGVGAFGDAMVHLKARGLDEAIRDFAASGKPVLGICLGMQLLFDKSLEFGEHEGLGLIAGSVEPFDPEAFDHPLKVPHMGWNAVRVRQKAPIFSGMSESFYLYFVHSFHVVCAPEWAIARTHYGYDFVSAVRNGNIYGLQPHPEKSHENGLRLLKNFLELA